MLDLAAIRRNPEILRKGLRARGDNADVDWFLRLDGDVRAIVRELQELRTRQNRLSPQIGRLKRDGGDASSLLAEVAELKAKQKQLGERGERLEQDLERILMRLPNLPADDVPRGRDDDDNVVVSQHGELREFDFEPKQHFEIAESLGMFDPDRSAKVAGSGFSLMTGALAQLERALWNYMLDLHTREHGYTEVNVPYLVLPEMMVGTGQLPKFEDQAYRCRDDELYLIPTAEVPVTNLHRQEILSSDDLPLRYTAFTPCFRRESGAAGTETRGLGRVHQFHKVEMVAFVRPEEAEAEHKRLLSHAETVLRNLELTYRVVAVCTGGMSFAAHRQFDLEVWAPGAGRWLEVSSVSTFSDFQARRAGVRFRREAGSKPEFVHTLNGSGVAMPRTIVALLENHQREDGSVAIPDALRTYMHWRTELR